MPEYNPTFDIETIAKAMAQFEISNPVIYAICGLLIDQRSESEITEAISKINDNRDNLTASLLLSLNNL